MSTNPNDLAKRVLRREWEHLNAHERKVIEAVLHRVSVTRDVAREAREESTFGQRLADRIASFGGSWPFILIFVSVLFGWVLLNTEILGPRGAAFDPYPYVFLNLMLSMVAALQAPVIMMSQNRQGERDRRSAEADFEVNLKAEIEIRHLHDKLDALRESQWAELVALQQEQLRLLQRAVGDSPGRGENA